MLGIGVHRDRERAVRHTVAAVGDRDRAGGGAGAGLAAAARPVPGCRTRRRAILPGTAGRLAWPLNYWNALAALLALGLPLLLALATSARTLSAQAAAAAAIPIVIALCAT